MRLVFIVPYNAVKNGISRGKIPGSGADSGYTGCGLLQPYRHPAPPDPQALTFHFTEGHSAVEIGWFFPEVRPVTVPWKQGWNKEHSALPWT